MIFENPKTRRSAHGQVVQESGRLTISQFLAVSRRYFDLAPKRWVYHLISSRGARQLPSIDLSSTQGGPRRLGYRGLVSSVLFASTLGLGAASSAYANPDCGSDGRMGKQRAERTERHNQRLRDALKLTPEQEGAWRKLIAAEHPVATAESSKQEDWAKLTAPERAEKMLERMKVRQSRMAEHVAALKEFYAALTPAQQKTFDDFHAGTRGGMRGNPGAQVTPQKS